MKKQIYVQWLDGSAQAIDCADACILAGNTIIQVTVSSSESYLIPVKSVKYFKITVLEDE